MFKIQLDNRGFIALIALVLLVTGTLTFALTTLASAVSYSDLVYRREFRIQAKFNAEACLDTATLMLVKDFFLNGEVSLLKFGCKVDIQNNRTNGNAVIFATSTLGGVNAYDYKSITF